MGDFDWDSIDVFHGEWWLLLIGLLLLCGGLAVGYWWGERVERQRLYRPEPPPTDLIP